MENFKRNGYNYERVKGWATKAKVNLHEMDKILFPINGADHWTLFIIHNDLKKTEWFDSLPSITEEDLTNGGKFKLVSCAKKYFRDEYESKKREPLNDSEWNFELTTEPRQRNFSDCGVFICTYADVTAAGWPICFEQHHMVTMRKKMMFELITGKMII